MSQSDNLSKSELDPSTREFLDSLSIENLRGYLLERSGSSSEPVLSPERVVEQALDIGRVREKVLERLSWKKPTHPNLYMTPRGDRTLITLGREIDNCFKGYAVVIQFIDGEVRRLDRSNFDELAGGWFLDGESAGKILSISYSLDPEA